MGQRKGLGLSVLIVLDFLGMGIMPWIALLVGVTSLLFSALPELLGVMLAVVI